MAQLDTRSDIEYTGRFAPSPTGPLHYGSLVAAVASFLDARHHNGQWLLRIEDLDPPRESPEAPDQIKRQLEAYSLNWDGQVLYQSSRLADYQEALYNIREDTFCCICSRKDTPPVYPGICRNRSIAESADKPVAVRLRVSDHVLSIDDRICGHHSWSMDEEVGDFIIRRKDGLFAYQLAVVVDDIYQKVNHVVRGRDLLDSTPRQLALYHTFGQTPPEYAHLPLVVDTQHVKLSKQAHARPVSTLNPLTVLRSVLDQLGQATVDEAESVEQLIDQAIRNWDIDAVTRSHELPEPSGIHEAS